MASSLGVEMRAQRQRGETETVLYVLSLLSLIYHCVVFLQVFDAQCKH